MVAEHGHIVHQHRVVAGDELGLAVLEVDVLDLEARAALGALHLIEHDGVAHHEVLGVELAEDREVAVALGIEGVAEAGHKLDPSATVVLIADHGALAALTALLEDHQVHVDVALAFLVVEEHQRLVGIDLDADADGVTLAVGRTIVQHDVVLLTHADGDGFDEAAFLLLGEHLVGRVGVHADGGLGGGGQIEERLFVILLLVRLGRLGCGLGVASRLGQRGAIHRSQVDGHRQHLVEHHVVGEVLTRVLVDQEVVVVPDVFLHDVDDQVAVIGDRHLVPHRVVLALEQVGVRLVGHHLHHAAAAVGGGRGAVGLVERQRDGKQTVARTHRQLDDAGLDGFRRSLFCGAAFLFLATLGGFGRFGRFLLGLRLHIGRHTQHQGAGQQGNHQAFHGTHNKLFFVLDTVRIWNANV